MTATTPPTARKTLNVEPVVLTGPTLRLEPARLEHAPALWRRLGWEVFQHTLEYPRDESLAAFEEWLAGSIAAPGALLFAIVPIETDPIEADPTASVASMGAVASTGSIASGESVPPKGSIAPTASIPPAGPVGVTGYLEIRPAHLGLEIGRTILAPAVQGTRVNPESKYLLLGHAFERLGAARVQFKTDLNNLHSQRALDKLGAVREGVLRRYQVRSSGRVRDSVVYSITSDEWPAIKAGLEARLGLAEP